jgi:hypothetical protein
MIEKKIQKMIIIKLIVVVENGERKGLMVMIDDRLL